MSKLLIIDDEEGIRKVLNLSLTNDGYEVSAAAGGEEGIEIFKKESPSIILTDIKIDQSQLWSNNTIHVDTAAFKQLHFCKQRLEHISYFDFLYNLLIFLINIKRYNVITFIN